MRGYHFRKVVDKCISTPVEELASPDNQGIRGMK